MGRPLDQESRIFGILRISELYILIGVFLAGLMFLPLLLKFLRPGLALGFLAALLLSLFSFFAISSGLPEGFFLNLLFFHTDNQVFFPGRETSKEGTDEN